MSSITQDTPKSRLLLFCRSIGIGSNKEIERLFCLANGYFKTAGGGMNTDSLAKIISIYPNLNISWLVNGKGSMYYTNSKALSVAEKGISYQVNDYLLPIRVFNCSADINSTDTTMPALWRMLPKNAFIASDFLLKITDDALSPSYEKGQFMLLGKMSDMVSKLSLFLLKNNDFIYGIPHFVNDNTDIIKIDTISNDKISFPDMVISVSDIQEKWVVKGVFCF